MNNATLQKATVVLMVVLTAILFTCGIVADGIKDFSIAYGVIIGVVVILAITIRGFAIACYCTRVQYNVWYIPFNIAMLFVVGYLSYDNVDMWDYVYTVILAFMFVMDLNNSMTVWLEPKSAHDLTEMKKQFKNEA